MTSAADMPGNPAELRDFVASVVDMRVMDLQRETLDALKRFGEGQARLEGRVDELASSVRMYRADFHGLLERFDSFQVEMRREHEVFRQEVKTENDKFRDEIRAENAKFRDEIRTENDKFRQEFRAENEKFRDEIRGENEKFRQEVWARFEQVDERFDSIDRRFEKIDRRFEKIDERFERIELRLFDMQKSIVVQTRWLVALLVAAPVIYSVMEKVLDKLVP